jgi:hypothetical protein
MAIEITSESLAGAQPERTADYKESPLAAVSEFPGSSQRISRSRFRLTNSTWTRRNFSSRARELSGGDAIILSIPKSGRTWLRAFLCAYFCRRFGLEFTLRTGRYDLPGFPRIVFSHDLFEHRTKGDRWDRIRGKYLVPRRELNRAKIILLARDPRDCLFLFTCSWHGAIRTHRLSSSKRPWAKCCVTKSLACAPIINAMNIGLTSSLERDNFTLSDTKHCAPRRPNISATACGAWWTRRPTRIFSRRRSSFPGSRTCKSSRPRELLIQTFCIRAMCAIQNRSRCVAER